MRGMKTGKAGGSDDIPVEVWKCVSERAVTFLTRMFNTMLKSERMPWEWRRRFLKVMCRTVLIIEGLWKRWMIKMTGDNQ